MRQRLLLSQPRVGSGNVGGASIAVLLALGCSGVGGKAERCLGPVRSFLAQLEGAGKSRKEACEAANSLRVSKDIACDPAWSAHPVASSQQGASSPLLALDGNPATAWRGAPGESRWEWTLPFVKPVHLGLLRAWYGDSSVVGVPASYRWEYVPSSGGGCDGSAGWRTLPRGVHDDRHPNEFVHGSKTVHAQKQLLFTEAEACAVRLVVESVDGGHVPVVRQIEIYASAPSLARGQGVVVKGDNQRPALPKSSLSGVVDGKYETYWAGERGAGKWSLEIHLPKERVVDRLWLLLGYDAVTVKNERSSGRRYTGAHLPLRYKIEIRGAENPERWEYLPEADSPLAQGAPLPVRRRLVRLSYPKPVSALRLTITEATGFWGESKPALTAPVVREIGLYEATDSRPVLQEPLFLSVNANPSELTRRTKQGEAYLDGGFARDIYHRLRRFLLGFDADSRWPADASRAREDGTGEFLEAIEGDDPVLDRPLLVESHPRPFVILSGGLNWEFRDRSGPGPGGGWYWNVVAPASSTERGMGQLADEVQERVAPFIGFCGGAQILGVLQSLGDERGSAFAPPPTSQRDFYRGLVLRNTNTFLNGIAKDKRGLERGWWYDDPPEDAKRPVVFFDPSDVLFETLVAQRPGPQSRAFPTSHYDMLRWSAFATKLPSLQPSAWSEFCRPWVQKGAEPVVPDPASPESYCVRIPQAFHSREQDRFPVIGFQFHAEQRDFPRLAPGAQEEERGDALNVFANAVDLAVEAYLRQGWSAEQRKED